MPPTLVADAGLKASKGAKTPSDGTPARLQGSTPKAANLQAAGNQAMQRLSLHARGPGGLTLSRPGDSDERDADRIADQVMRMDDLAPIGPAHHTIQRKCTACSSGGSLCPECEEQARIKQSTLPGVGRSSNVASSVQGGHGEPLSATTRAFFEPRFGQDFSGVRVHNNSSAHRAADSIGARAFTLGNDVAFAEGQFEPETPDGQRLLAHELTHVIQQSGNGATRRIMRQEKPNAAAAPPMNSLTPQETACYAPVGPTLTFEGIVLAGNRDYAESILREYIAKHGENETRSFVSRLRDHVSKQVANSEDLDVEDPVGFIENDPRYSSKPDVQIAVAATQALTTVLTRNEKWLASFEAKANEVVLGMLDESEARVKEEQIRYGVDWEDFEGDGEDEAPPTMYSMKDTPGSRALGEAAQGLLDRKQKYDKARKEMADEYPEVGQGLVEIAGQRGFMGNSMSRYNQMREVRDHAKRDLDIFRQQKTGEFPILASYASDTEIDEDKLKALTQLAKGPNEEATSAIGEEIKSRLEHIADVRKDILENGGKKTKIWQVPKIIEGTRDIMGVMPGSMYARVVDDKVRDEAPGIWTSILLGLLQLVLVLLAPATGGLTLLGAAAISAGQAYAHFREYERAQMLRGTDFGALALSAEDPSLFWLAVDIVGAGFDLGAAAGAAAKLFSSLAPAARAARAARTLEEAKVAAADLERIGTELGGEALGKAVARDALDVSTTARVGETAEEARALERVTGQMAERELKSGFTEVESIAGRKIKVSESGSLWSCASPCTLLRERYKGLLRRKGTDWETRLKDLEDEAKAAGSLDAKEAEIARKEVAKKAAALEREMRTQALPGEWTSPLAKKAKYKDTYKDMVERRGSIAPELDSHPRNWTGEDEAFFRYGEDAEEAEEGYRWLLDENGKLRYDHMRQDLPTREFNPATGEFELAAEKGLKKSTRELKETREIANIPEKERKAMAKAFAERESLITKRDPLSKLEKSGTIVDKDAQALGKLRAQINEQSRQFGENAAEGIMKGRGAKKVYPLDKIYSTSGDFDQVWKVGDEFQIVEAKGGSSGLGSRMVGEGVRAEQGTAEYAKSIADNMAKNGATREIKKLGRELQTAIANGKFKYILVQAPIAEELQSTVVKISEFVVR